MASSYYLTTGPTHSIVAPSNSSKWPSPSIHNLFCWCVVRHTVTQGPFLDWIAIKGSHFILSTVDPDSHSARSIKWPIVSLPPLLLVPGEEENLWVRHSLAAVSQAQHSSINIDHCRPRQSPASTRDGVSCSPFPASTVSQWTMEPGDIISTYQIYLLAPLSRLQTNDGKSRKFVCLRPQTSRYLGILASNSNSSKCYTK